MVVFVGQGNWAHRDTIAAGRALCRIDETGLLADGDFEITGGPCNPFNFGAGNQIDIEMPADLDQFG
jgi:hypothetical protein